MRDINDSRPMLEGNSVSRFTCPPILENGPYGTPNPVLAFLKEKVSPANMKAILRETPESLALLYFHAQSLLASIPPEVRAQVRDALIVTLRQRYINPNQIEVPNGGGGPYQGRNVYFVYLLIEIFDPDLLTVEEKRALNTQLFFEDCRSGCCTLLPRASRAASAGLCHFRR